MAITKAQLQAMITAQGLATAAYGGFDHGYDNKDILMRTLPAAAISSVPIALMLSASPALRKDPSLIKTIRDVAVMSTFSGVMTPMLGKYMTDAGIAAEDTLMTQVGKLKDKIFSHDTRPL